MRYPPDHKLKARAALLAAGTREMQTAGFNGVGVDALSAAADVTSGAFYSNFANKEQMLESIVEMALGEPFLTESQSAASKAERRVQLTRFLTDYLSAGHVDDPAGGCVMPALSADVARAGQATRQAYESRIVALAERIAGSLDGRRPERERRAWSIIALMVGAVSIARAMGETDARFEVIAAARRTANGLVAPGEQ